MRSADRPVVVVLFRQAGDSPSKANWRIVDHFVLEQSGRWAFGVTSGAYAVAAFEDLNKDLIYRPGEPFAVEGSDTPLACANGSRIRGIELAIAPGSKQRSGPVLDIARLQARNLHDQIAVSLGQLTVEGEIARLTDARFDDKTAESALWRPFDFVVSSYAGIYFLEPYDKDKVPVLFVHGINGSPANFSYLIERLDRSRFQPWVYYYPTGVSLERAAAHLDQTMAKLEARYRLGRYAVVAHSMGGLVSLRFLQRQTATVEAGRVPLFITISTPWQGHRGAELGVRTAPVVVRVWEDMAPKSEFLRNLFSRPLPRGTTHQLIFTYNDETVTLQSQLRPEAQAEARKLYGFGETHMGVLRNADVSALVNRLLAESY
jgi:pimeloyl-ACP methyl ester carboxylesterase